MYSCLDVSQTDLEYGLTRVWHTWNIHLGNLPVWYSGQCWGCPQGLLPRKQAATQPETPKQSGRGKKDPKISQGKWMLKTLLRSSPHQMVLSGPGSLWGLWKPGGVCLSKREIILQSSAFQNYLNIVHCILCIHAQIYLLHESVGIFWSTTFTMWHLNNCESLYLLTA